MVLTIVGAIAAADPGSLPRAQDGRAVGDGTDRVAPDCLDVPMLEDILIGAAVVSIPVCTVLFLMMGGFTG